MKIRAAFQADVECRSPSYTIEEPPMRALKWLVNLLNRHQIPYQITGGLAAKIYGVDRPLADIDIDLPNQAIDLLLPEIENYLTFGPCYYEDANWKIFLATLSYEGQLIDLSGADDGFLFDVNDQAWKKCEVNFKAVQHKSFDGLLLSVINPQDLLRYKSQLGREVDLFDVSSLKRIIENNK